jgi:hypothetical protein
MRLILKFPIDPSDAETWGNNLRVRLIMPRGSRVIYVATQNDVPTLWAECERSAPSIVQFFFLVGTGRDIPPSAGAYLGSCQGANLGGSPLTPENLVYHIYECLAE